MPTPTFFPTRAYFGVQRDRTREFGVEWPEGAVCRIRPEHHVVTYEGAGVQALRTSQQGDVLRRAFDAVARGTTKRARVGVAVGTFGDLTLYEEVGRFQDPDFKSNTLTELPANAKTVHLKISKVSGEEVEGLASTPNVDREFDRILPEAFAKSLPAFKQNPTLLFNHNRDWPIGNVVELEVRPEGLWCKCRVDDERVRNWVSRGNVRSFSVSFIPTARRFEPNKQAQETDPTGERRPPPPEIRVITEAELLEISIVTIPCNRESLFSVTKSLDAGTDLICRGCGVAGVTCDCDGGSRVVAPRSFPVSAKGLPFTPDGREVVRRLGARGLRQSSAWTDGEDPLDAAHALFVHHHLDEGELRLSGEGMQYAMARLLAGHDDLSPGDRRGVHAHLAAHYRELGRTPPAYDQAPDPSSTYRVAFEGAEPPVGLLFDKSSATGAAAWAKRHGFPDPTSAGEDYDGRTLVTFAGWAESAGRRRTVELADGVLAVVRGAAEPVAVPKESPVTMPKSPENAPDKSTHTPAPAVEETTTDADDELMEVDSDLLTQLESATKDPDAPVDGDLAERLLEQTAETVQAHTKE